MARYKRYFPVSHDINRDPEVIEMMETFGGLFLMIWLEILAKTDRTEGELMGIPGSSASTLARLQDGDLRRETDRIRRRWKGLKMTQRVEMLLYWMCLKGWLIPIMPASDGENRYEILTEWSSYRQRMVHEWCTNRDKIISEWSSNHWPNGEKIIGFIVRNYAEYHRTRSAISRTDENQNKKFSASPNLPTYQRKNKTARARGDDPSLRSVEEEEALRASAGQGTSEGGNSEKAKEPQQADYLPDAFDELWDMWPRKEGLQRRKKYGMN